MRRKRTNRPFIPRREIKFWLRTDREGEARLIQFIDYLKKTRQFATKVKQGLRLIWTLEEGNTEFLFSLFPHLQEVLKPPPTPTPTSSGDLERVAELAAQRAAQQVVMNLPAQLPAGRMVAEPPEKPSRLASNNTLGKNVQFTAAPSEDDDDGDTIIITKDDKTPSAETQTPMGNMLAGLIDPRTGRLREQSGHSIALD